MLIDIGTVVSHTWLVWIVLALLSVITFYVMRGSQGYDHYTDRPRYERGRCNARNGDLVCTLDPHDTGLHLDERAGSMYHSAPFREATR